MDSDYNRSAPSPIDLNDTIQTTPTEDDAAGETVSSLTEPSPGPEPSAIVTPSTVVPQVPIRSSYATAVTPILLVNAGVSLMEKTQLLHPLPSLGDALSSSRCYWPTSIGWGPVCGPDSTRFGSTDATPQSRRERLIASIQNALDLLEEEEEEDLLHGFDGE